MAIPAPLSVTNFRPIGESRIYTIMVKDSVMGHLKSTIKKRVQVDDVNGVAIEQELLLDYTLIGGDRKISIVGQHFVSDRGYYLGDNKIITSQGRSETLKLSRTGERIAGSFTRGGNPVELSEEVPSNTFAFDNNFFDQLELIIAMQRLEVGETIEQDIVEPQSLLRSRLKAVVEGFEYMRLHKTLADSVFLINVFEPQPMLLYFSKSRRLLKTEIENQKMTIYLDRVISPPAKSGRRTQIGLMEVLLNIPGYFVNLILASLAALFFIGRGCRWRATYLAFGGGVLLFAAIPVTQIPLQNFLMEQIFIPGIKAGGSPFLYGILPSLAAGVIQETLKLAAVLGIIRILKVKSYQFLAIGAVIGAGFGFVEACYLNTMIGSFVLVSMVLVERISFFLFHVTSGAMMGLSQSVSNGRLAVTITITIMFNTLLRYLPLFVRQQSVDLKLMYLIMAVLVLCLLMLALFRAKSVSGSAA